jgi:hypothetical protein
MVPFVEVPHFGPTSSQSHKRRRIVQSDDEDVKMEDAANKEDTSEAIPPSADVVKDEKDSKVESESESVSLSPWFSF